MEARFVAPPKTPWWRINFSKMMLASIMFCYFYGVYVGGVIVKIYPELLREYLLYLGSPVPVAIGFYSTKALKENMMKIKEWGPAGASEGVDEH